MTSNEYIKLLNEMRALEMRMALTYRRLASVITGPWRDSLSDELLDHSDDELKHADILMRRIVALGGKIDVDVPQIPDWNSLEELVSGLVGMEADGLSKWRNLLKKLPDDDAFRHVIEDILTTEMEHYDEALIWRSSFGKTKLKEDFDSAPLESPEQEPLLPPESTQPEPELAGYPVVGESRRLVITMATPNFSHVNTIGEAWQTEDGEIDGTGVVGPMIFEVMQRQMYRSSSIGMDISPLAAFAMRLQRNPFIMIKWEENNGR